MQQLLSPGIYMKKLYSRIQCFGTVCILYPVLDASANGRLNFYYYSYIIILINVQKKLVHIQLIMQHYTTKPEKNDER